MARGRRQKSESRPDLIFFFVFKISKDPRVCCVLGYLCNALWIKLKDGVGLSNGSCHWVGPSDGGPTCNGITRGRAASRSPDAADLPPTLVVFSKCGVGKDLGAKTKKLFQCNPCSPARDQEPICLQHLRFPNSSWCPSLVAWSSIPRVMQYYLFLETFGFKKKKMFKILILPKVKTQELQFKVDAK